MPNTAIIVTSTEGAKCAGAVEQTPWSSQRAFKARLFFLASARMESSFASCGGDSVEDELLWEKGERHTIVAVELVVVDILRRLGLVEEREWFWKFVKREWKFHECQAEKCLGK